MVFGNKVLRRIFGPKRDQVAVWLRKLHNGELFNLHSSPSLIRTIKQRRRMRWEGHVAQVAEEEYVIGGKPRRKKTTRRNKM
jgi:hypothetical protein